MPARLKTLDSLLECKQPPPKDSESLHDGDNAVQRAHAQRLESLGVLASGVAHELNNPIGAVMSLSQLIADDPEATDSLRRYARLILSESERMGLLVQNLLSFSHQKGEASAPHEIQELVERTLALMSAALRKDRIQLLTRIPEALPKVTCREQQLQQVLVNLLTNARDALNARFPGPSLNKVIQISVWTFTRQDKAWIRISVEDEGIGIEPELIDNLFEPFFTTKPEHEGTGLGLSICREIIHEHGGRITAHSQPWAGARFDVDLPVG